MNIETVHLHIGGMSCANCVNAIERELLALDGVRAAVVNLEAKEAVVQYSPEIVQPSELVVAINEAGYSASAMQPASSK